MLLYDLTSTYFESDPPLGQGDKRKHGYSRDKRPDCVQVVIGLIVTPEGFPLAYEVMAGNTIDKPDSSCHQELEILLRWTSAPHHTTGYECFARCVNDGASYVQVVRWEGPLGKFTPPCACPSRR